MTVGAEDEAASPVCHRNENQQQEGKADEEREAMREGEGRMPIKVRRLSGDNDWYIILARGGAPQRRSSLISSKFLHIPAKIN